MLRHLCYSFMRDQLPDQLPGEYTELPPLQETLLFLHCELALFILHILHFPSMVLK